MIQFAKDLFVTCLNLTQPTKEAKNRDNGEEFASVLKVEDSQVVTKSNTLVDNERIVFIDNPLSKEQKFSISREDLINDRVEKLSSSIENLSGKVNEEENDKDNDKDNETGGKNDGFLSVGLHICVPFISEENIKNSMESNINLPNIQECETKDIQYCKVVINGEKYPVSSNSDEALSINPSDFSDFYEGEMRAQNYIGRNQSLPLNAENPEKSDKSFNGKMNEADLLSEDGKFYSTSADLFNPISKLGLEEDSGKSMNTFEGDSFSETLHVNEKIDVPIESNDTRIADLNLKMNVDSSKQNVDLTSESGEKASELTTDEAEQKSIGEIIVPAKASELPKGKTLSKTADKTFAPQRASLLLKGKIQTEAVDSISVPVNYHEAEDNSIRSSNNINSDFDYDSNQKDNIDGQNKKSIYKDVNLPVIDDLDTNDLTDNATINRQEFQSFMHRIYEEQSLTNNEYHKSILKSQQMNLINKGRLAFSESVENVVKFIRNGALTKATLIVDPPSLGKVNIEIVSTDKGIEAVLRVSNEQIKMLVQDNSVNLKQNLAQVGVILSDFSVDVQHEGSRSRNQSFNNHRSKKSARFGSTAFENETERIETFRVDLRKGLLHWIG